MPSKRNAINKRKHRKEFRKQHRKLKKKSKKLARQFGKLEREKKLKIKTRNTSNKQIKSILKPKSKYNQRNSKKKLKKSKSSKKSVRFAEKEQIKIIPSRTAQTQTQTHSNNVFHELTEMNEESEDIWIDEREEKWIKTLEKRMGFTHKRNSNEKYWQRQEFTQDGLNCFFDLEQLSDDSDIDDERKENYQKYVEFKDFLSTQQISDDKPNLQWNVFKQTTLEKRQKKEEIYGEAVHHSDSDSESESDSQNDILIKQFLEESDDSDTDNETMETKERTVKYVPPQLRKLKLLKTDSLGQLKRLISGHLNRLLSHNLNTVSAMINGFHSDNDSKYSRSEVTEAFCECVYNIIYDKESNNALKNIILCLSGLIVKMYQKNGMNIGSNMIETFSKYIQSRENNKFMSNLVRIVSYLYLFGMLNAKYIIEILIDCVQNYGNELECWTILYTVMDICGVNLRYNNPIKFKDLILLICAKSKQISLLQNGNNKITKYSLQMEQTMKLIFDIKDNKILNSNKNNIINSRQFKQIKSSFEGSITKISVGFTDFISIPMNGRWWLAGAAVRNGKNNNSKRIMPVWKSTDEACSFPEKLLKMAKEFHMNTPIRKAIFCIVMDSNDYIEAFQKLQQLNISGQHSEIIRIILLLCVRQMSYNKYYCLLLGKLIKHNKGWKFSLHCAVWDKFNEINEMATNDILIMAQLLADLINLHYLNLVVLKRLDIINTQTKNMLFVNTLFRYLLVKNHVFGTLSRNNKLKELRQDIQMYLASLMVPRTKAQIMDCKAKHKNAQMLFKQNKTSKDALINIGLELRGKEDFLILIKSVLNSMQDYQIQSSSYNDLI